ncbi:MAG: arginase, partial [Proteobacteria bacterium]|nr:arginase [Pseudomonadota bacterium]
NISEQEKDINNIVPTLASCKVLNEKTTLALNKGHIPIILGGDHSLSIGSVSAVSSFYEKQQKKVGLIWIDSHADINIPSTSPSNNLFGMSVASLLDLFTGYATTMQTKRPAVDINNLVYIGLRDLDKGEVEFIKDLKINAFTIKDIDILGMAEVTKRAIQIATDNTCGYVLSFDLDVCDPSIVPGTQTPVRGGITFREAHLLMELIADNQKMLSLEMVELNPLLDRDFITAELAVSLIESGLGKKIL